MLNRVKQAAFRLAMPVRNKKGMEMVQVAILVPYLYAMLIDMPSNH